MRKHVRAFTYKPKIPAVLAGECTQTIRPYQKHGEKDKTLVKPGDEILFHGWSGRPYQSKWSWRLRIGVREVWTITVTDKYGVLDTRDDDDITGALPTNITHHEWGDLDWLAKADGLEPPTGATLKEFLQKGGYDVYQIIRWLPTSIIGRED